MNHSELTTTRLNRYRRRLGKSKTSNPKKPGPAVHPSGDSKSKRCPIEDEQYICELANGGQL